MCISKRINMAISVAGSILILFSCAKDPTEIERTPTSTFPLTEGSRWHYSGYKIFTNLDNTAQTDTVESEIFRNILGPDTSLQIPGLVAMDDTIITRFFLVDTTICRKWVKLEDNELRLYAYDCREVGDEPQPGLFQNSRLLIDYPLSVEKTWYEITDEYIGFLYSVVGIEYISTGNSWAYCDVIYYDEMELEFGSYGDTISSSYEWYSDNGLMRKEKINKLEYYIGQPLNWAQTYEYFELVDMAIQP